MNTAESKIHYPTITIHALEHPSPQYQIPRLRHRKPGTASSRLHKKQQPQTNTQSFTDINTSAYGQTFNHVPHFPPPPNPQHLTYSPPCHGKVSIKTFTISDWIDNYKYPYPFFRSFRRSRSSQKYFLLNYLFKIKSSIACFVHSLMMPNSKSISAQFINTIIFEFSIYTMSGV